MNDKENSIRAKHVKQHIAVIYRIFFLVIFIAIQLAAIVYVFLLFRRQFAYFYIVCEILSIFVVLHIVRQDINPTYKIPWIVLSLALPILGGLTYLMFGRVRLNKSEKQRAKELGRCHLTAIGSRPEAGDKVPKRYRTQSRYLRQRAGAPAYANTEVEFFPLGEDFFVSLIDELEKAENFIFMEYFIIGPGRMWDTIEDVLSRKAAQGVDVRVVYDDIGCLGFLPSGFDKQLEKKGIACHVFNPFTNIFSARFNNRDHRKICVIDGNVGYTGGINLSDEYINAYEKHGHWKDTAILLRGEGVWSLTVMFLSLWDFECNVKEDYLPFAPQISVTAPGIVQPYTDIPQDSEYVGETVYLNMLTQARDYVYITSPYLIIDNEMITALTTAAKSGVDVRIITPGVPDKKITYRLTRSYYAVLLQAGVKIYEYTPGFIHAKEFVADDRCAVVGTINLDYRSLCHHFECAVWMCDVPAVADIKADFLATQAKCHRIDLDMCRKKFNGHPLLMSLLRIFSPLF